MAEPRQVSIVVACSTTGDDRGAGPARARHPDGERPAYEIILVDDGSHDRTVEDRPSPRGRGPRVRVFEFTRNFGQAAALACGIFAARGDSRRGRWTAICRTRRKRSPTLVAAIDAGAGVATGRRGTRYESFGRWLGSRIIHRLARALTGAAIDDFGGNFKAYRRDVVEGVRQVWGPGKPFFPLALWLGYSVCGGDRAARSAWEGHSRIHAALAAAYQRGSDHCVHHRAARAARRARARLCACARRRRRGVAILGQRSPPAVGIVLAATL
jgi:glycosyltransferase involved in cell wall biosynthesis